MPFFDAPSNARNTTEALWFNLEITYSADIQPTKVILSK